MVCARFATVLALLTHALAAAASALPASGENASTDTIISCTLSKGGGAGEDRLDCGDHGIFYSGDKRSAEAGELPVGSELWVQYALMSVCCVVAAAFAAGLTMGLMSMDEFDMDLCLEVDVADVPSEVSQATVLKEQKYARIINPVISRNFFSELTAGRCCIPTCIDPTNHHYLLVTLLVVNAAANEALPVFLDNLVPAWAAVLISVSFVLVFGEILPSAIFTGPNQMAIAARLCPLVTCIKVLLVPLVWPISLLLDRFLGHEHDEGFKRYELKALTKMMYKKGSMGKRSHSSGMLEDEKLMINGVMDLGGKVVSDRKIMQKWQDAKLISFDVILDQSTLAHFQHLNHSRLLMYKPNPNKPDQTSDIVGVCLVKRLIAIDPNDALRLDAQPLRRPLVFQSQTSLIDALNKFQEGHSHIAIVTADKAAVEAAWAKNESIPEHALPFGFITLEDIIEEMLGEEVYDETDRQDTLIKIKKLQVLDKMVAMAANARNKVRKRHPSRNMTPTVSGNLREPMLA